MFGIRLGLDSSRRILNQLGSPQEKSSVILVAGTNGKGSTAALLAAMTTAAGYCTGLYTSPHLESVEERIRVNGKAISAEDLCHCLNRVLVAASTVNDSPPTYFEALTLAAVLYFAEVDVELAILEVGLGGRLDATNVCEPVLSVITEIALDHQAHLGDSLEEIAREKAGILRPQIPAIAWISERAAFEAVNRRATEIGCPLIDARDGTEIYHEEKRRSGALSPFRVTTFEDNYSLKIGLLGEHQRRNAALALRAAEVLRRLAGEGFSEKRLDHDALISGAGRCLWPGRLEEVSLPDGRRSLLEAAHNPHGAMMLGDFLERVEEPVDILFGVLEDKDGGRLIETLGDLPRRWTLTAPPGERGRDPHTLPLPQALAAGDKVSIEPHPEKALDLALERLKASGTGILVVFGSLFLVGFARKRLRNLFGVPAPAAKISTVSSQTVSSKTISPE